MNTNTSLNPKELNEILDYYDEIIKKRVTTFTNRVKEYLLSNEELEALMPLIKVRIKSRESLKRKIESKYDPDDFLITKASLTQTIEDLGGIRVIVYKRPDIQKVINIVKAMDITRNASSIYSIKDEKPYYIFNKSYEWGEDFAYSLRQFDKRKVYRSTHFILMDRLSVDRIRCELQIRTIFDEAVFENYHKLVYKGSNNKYITTIMNNIAEECQLIDDLITQCYYWYSEDKSNLSD